MTSAEDLQQRINALIREQLNKYRCISGSLHYRPASLSLKGVKADGKPILIWEQPRQLNILLSKLMENYEEGAGLTIAAHNNGFIYDIVTAASLKQEADKAKQEQEEANRQYKIELKSRLSQQTALFGSALASKVADTLEHSGDLTGTHQGYCGMGLKFHEGVYYYGEIWEGAMPGSSACFDNRTSFTGWLAQQSDASMARLEEENPFYWGNQTITRQQLETFVSGTQTLSEPRNPLAP